MKSATGIFPEKLNIYMYSYFSNLIFNILWHTMIRKSIQLTKSQTRIWKKDATFFESIVSTSRHLSLCVPILGFFSLYLFPVITELTQLHKLLMTTHVVSSVPWIKQFLRHQQLPMVHTHRRKGKRPRTTDTWRLNL